MKKLFLTASLFLSLTAINAQESKPKNHPEKPSMEQQLKEFDDLNLNSSQKKQIKKLFKEREEQFKKDRPQKPPVENGGKQEFMHDKDNNRGNDKFEKERKEFNGRIQKILTPEQYNKFQEKHEKHEKHFKEEGQKKEDNFDK